MSLREAAQQSLEALENSSPFGNEDDHVGLVRLHYAAIKALRNALAEPDKPCPYIRGSGEGTHWCALAAQRTEPVQEPVALETFYETIIHWDEGGGKRSRRELARRIVALYTHPLQRKPLTDEQICGAFRKAGLEAYHQRDAVVEMKYDRRINAFARAIERAHGIGGEA